MRIGIIGGGLLGMNLARLCRAEGYEVTLLEAESELGGLLKSIGVGGVVLDRFYHVILPTDSRLLDLIAELGLSDQVQWKTTQTGFYANGVLHPMNNIWQFLTFAPLNLYERLRLGLCVAIASKVRDWRPLETITATAWFTKLAGKRVTEKIWNPLLQAKFAEYWDKVNAAYMWGTINRIHGARQGTVQKEALGCIRGGYAPFLQAMTARLQRLGVSIQTEMTVQQLVPMSTGEIALYCCNANGEIRHWSFDKVVSTLPPSILDNIMKSQQGETAAFPTLGIIEGLLLLKNPLSPFYVINITDRSIPFTGIIEYTNVADRKDYKDFSIVFISRYVDSNSIEFSKSDESIKSYYLKFIKKMFPSYNFSSNIHSFEIMRTRYLQPVHDIHYGTRIPDMKTCIDNVYSVNTVHIHPWPVFANETLNLSHTVFEQYLSKKK